MATGTLYANVPLSNKYKDIPRFKSNDNVTTFLEQYSTHEYPLSNDFNIAPFGQGDELITSLVIDTSTFGLQRDIIMGFNYLKVAFAQGECFLQFIYYFITDIDWLGGRNTTTNNFGKVLLHLEVDVATTFKLCYDVRTGKEVFTERRHCSRFVKVGNKYMFNDTEVLTGDPLDSEFQADIPEKPVYYKQKRRHETTQQDIYNFIDKFEWTLTICKDKINGNITTIPYIVNYQTSGNTKRILVDKQNQSRYQEELQLINNDKRTYSGVYLYLSPVYKKSVEEPPYSTYDDPGISTDIYNEIFCVYKNFTPSIQGTENANYICPILEPDNEKYGSIIIGRLRLPLNFVYQFVFDVIKKRTCVVPNFGSIGSSDKNIIKRELICLWEDYELITAEKELGNKAFSIVGATDGTDYIYEYQTNKGIYRSFYELGLGCYWCINELNYKNDNFMFESDETISPIYDSLPSIVTRNINLEPKLMIEPYSTYSIKSKVGTPNGFTFNPLLLETDKMNIIFKYVPNTSTAKFSMFIEPFSKNNDVITASQNSPYYNLYSLNVGDINISDYTLPIKSDPFYQMALEQRNYRTTGLAVPVISSLTQSAGLVGSTALFNPKALLSSVAGASIGVSSAISAMGNYYAHIDNLKNAPDSIQNSGNDALHDICLGQDLRPYLSVYRLKSAQQKQVYDYYYRYGYMINTYEPMSAWFTRQLFNYIKTNDDDLENKFKSRKGSRPFPQFIRRALADILNNGVTFWEMEQIDKFMNRSYENAEYADKVPER